MDHGPPQCCLWSVGISDNRSLRKRAVKKGPEYPDVQLRKPPTFLEEVLQLVLERLQILLWGLLAYQLHLLLTCCKEKCRLYLINNNYLLISYVDTALCYQLYRFHVNQFNQTPWGKNSTFCTSLWEQGYGKHSIFLLAIHKRSMTCSR